MRARPPPEMEFIDIFQKFKLSFNLLAKLKAHIHDPNAPELVHFLFTPLALIVDASHDTNYGPNLPAKVVSPLLTREAVNLLINCVTSKETELWHSLGDAWLIPRDQWKGYVPPYHPVFLDGWSPEYPVADERDHMSAAIGPTAATTEGTRDEPSPTDAGRYGYDPRNYGARPDVYSRDERDLSPSPGPPHSDISADSIERGGGVGTEAQQRFERSQARFLDELRSRGGKVVQVTYPRTANNEKELTVVRGEFLEVVDDSRKWWKARNFRGQVAHVPHTIVTPYPGGDPSDVFSNPLYAPPHGYPGQDTTDGPRPARSPPMPPPAPADWVRKERLGKKEPYWQDNDLNTDEDVSRNHGRSVGAASPPPPPPPPTESAPASPVALRSQSATLLSRDQSSQDLQDELKSVLDMFREKRRNLDIVKTPEVYISQRSNPDEVQNWLAAKGFSGKTCKKLKGVSGGELFSLGKSKLEQCCGKDEGHRLDSQLHVQRSISGYKTTRSQELQAILARARERVEEGNKDGTLNPKSVAPRQRPPLQDFNEASKQHTLSVEPSDFEGDEPEGSESGNSDSHLSTLLRNQLHKMSKRRNR